MPEEDELRVLTLSVSKAGWRFGATLKQISHYLLKDIDIEKMRSMRAHISAIYLATSAYLEGEHKKVASHAAFIMTVRKYVPRQLILFLHRKSALYCYVSKSSG